MTKTLICALLFAAACGGDDLDDADERPGERTTMEECMDFYRQTEDCCAANERANDAQDWCSNIIAQFGEDPWYYDANQCTNFSGFCATWGFCTNSNPQRVESPDQTYSACMADRGVEP